MRETFEKLKKCKNIKEIYEVLPPAFYETGSAIMICLVLLMIVFETVTRYMTRHQSLDQMIAYFNNVGYVMIIFAIMTVIIKSVGVGNSGVKAYFRNNKQDLLFLLFLSYALMATLFSKDKNTAFFGDWYRNCGLRTYFIFAAIYICGKNIRYQQKINNRIKQYIYGGFLIVCTIQNLLFITKYLGYFGSKTGAFYNTNHSAYFMTIAICAGIGYISESRNMVIKIVGVVFYTVNISCLILNNTFGCYLALIFAFVFMIAISLVKTKKIKLEIMICIFLFIAVSIMIDQKSGIVSSNFGVTANDVAVISSEEGDIGNAGTGRMKLWIDNMKYVKKHPVIGCGPDCITEINIDQYGNDVETEDVQDLNGNEDITFLREPHNEYLQFAGEIGPAASFAYVLALVLIFLKRIAKIKNTDDSVVYDGGAVFGYCVSAFFGVVMFYTEVFFFIFLGMVSSDEKTEHEMN
ncbi:MAG: O-antigen ligase family protein [Lachnospiraceae bacterium]|nr:O-antigen ligase family protein [Lachnospiraceae bacterium]